jgi:4-amino-4-deoxy-L-arabinose transferase-like glycosyltransferase
MNLKLKKLLYNQFVLFLAIWGIINLIQARFTPLDNDEAYYWMYSKYLAWGYFDHPPMIALMIKAGYLFFHNELGVRLLTVFSQLATLYIIWLITDKETREQRGNVLIFYMLAILMPVNIVYGFISTPDAPLILFTAVFLLIYKRFLENESPKNTILLGLSIAALAYSKYHGAILILLVILSNPRLLRSIRFYMAGAIAFILLLPHLYWQYSNGFPSLKYHLVERVSAFNPEHVPDYLVSQFSFHNPFLLVVLVWIMIKVRSGNLLDKALKFIFTGFLIFFFISSFRYRVEPQWTAVICVPALILLFNNIEFKPWLRNYIKWVTIILFPFFIVARLAAAIDFLPLSFLKNEFHNKKQWVNDISTIAGSRPVVFTNSYQQPSVYTFYTGKLAYTLDNLSYRKTQYDLWDFEEQVHGKEVLYVPHLFSDAYKRNLTKKILSGGDSAFVRIFSNFQSLQKECVILNSDNYTFSRSDTNVIHLRLFNPYPYPIDFKNIELPVVFQIAFLKNGMMAEKKNLDLPGTISVLSPGDTIAVDFKFTLKDVPSGSYSFGICSEEGILYDTFNSKLGVARIRD